jgi:hypothetical protein
VLPWYGDHFAVKGFWDLWYNICGAASIMFLQAGLLARRKPPTCGVDSESRVSKGVEISVDREWESRITNYKYVNERIISMRLKYERGNVTILGVYAPEAGKKDHKLYITIHRRNLSSLLKAAVLY